MKLLLLIVAIAFMAKESSQKKLKCFPDIAADIRDRCSRLFPFFGDLGTLDARPADKAAIAAIGVEILDKYKIWPINKTESIEGK